LNKAHSLSAIYISVSTWLLYYEKLFNDNLSYYQPLYTINTITSLVFQVNVGLLFSSVLFLHLSWNRTAWDKSHRSSYGMYDLCVTQPQCQRSQSNEKTGYYSPNKFH